MYKRKKREPESVLKAFLAVACIGALASFGAGCSGMTGSAQAPQPSGSPPVTVSISPTSNSVPLGEAVSFSAAVSDAANPAVLWSVNGIAGGNAAVGTISGSGVYTAPQVLPSPDSVTVKATSFADPAKSAVASVTVTSDVHVNVSPASASVELGAQRTFQASIASTGQPDMAVNWGVSGPGCSGAACGSVTPAGLFTAPRILPSPPSVILTATSVADPSKSSTAAVAVTSTFTFSISGPSSLATGSSATFTATIAPAPGSNPDPSVTWSVSGAGCSGSVCGTIVGSGATATYEAPSSPPSSGTVTVTATPAADPSKAASTSVTITSSAVAVRVSPSAATLALGTATNFAATVSGTTDTAVTWSVDGILGGDSTVGTIVASSTDSDQSVYTAPSAAPSTNPVTVQASSQTDSSAGASATVMLTPAVSVLLSSSSATLAVGLRQTFTAQVQNSANTDVTWEVNGLPGGNTTVGQICAVNSSPCQTVTSGVAGSVDYLAPAAVPSVNPVTLSVISQADPTQSASGSITILPHVVVSVSPPSLALAPGSSQLFSATVEGTSDQQVTWSIAGSGCSGSGASCGTIDATGLYQAPQTPPSPDTLNVVATSSEYTTRNASAAVTITTQPSIKSLLPSSATAGASGGFTLRVSGANFAPSSPGPGSTIVIDGTDRTTLCDTTSDCSTDLSATDLSLAATLTIQVRNPDGSVSNTVSFVVVPAAASADVISLTPGAPVAAGKDITVVDLSTDGSSSPQNANLNVAAIGPYDASTGNCSLDGGPVILVPPSSGTATVNLCAFSVSGLDPSFSFTLTGPSPNDIAIVGKAPLGLGIVQLTLQISSAAQAGARTLFIQNSNLDTTAATGAIDVQ